jgi:hypothetical protein
MKQWMGCAALVLAFAAAPAAAQMSKGAGVEADIQALLNESAAAWNRGDLKGHLADNADSIRFMTGKGPVIGKQQTEAILRRRSSAVGNRFSRSASSRWTSVRSAPSTRS